MADLYDAIEDDGALSELSAGMAAACRARSGMILYSASRERPHFFQMSYWPAEAAELYIGSFADRDPWLQQAQAVGVEDQVINMDELVPAEAFTQTAMYNDLFRTLGDDTGRCMGIFVRMGAATLVAAVHRPLSAEPFGMAEQERLADTFVHVRRILRVRQVLAVEQRRVARAHALLESDSCAALIVDKRMRVLSIAPAAARCLALGDGLALREGELSVVDGSVASTIRRAVISVIERTPVKRTAFLCQRPSGKRAWRLLLLPAGSSGADGALIVIDDPQRRIEGAKKNRFSEAYDLTRVEAEVADALIEGLTLQRIAVRRGVALETIRSHLKSIFVKTDTHRQGEVVALLT